jgi:hypothetical protein
MGQTFMAVYLVVWAEAALGRLSLSLAALHILPDVGFAEKNGADLYGSLSPRV